MPIVTGQILALGEKIKRSFFFQGKREEEKSYVYANQSIGQLEVGKTFTYELVPQFRASSIFNNPNGEYKLVQIKADKKGVLYPFFKSKTSGETIVVSIKVPTFNNFIIGDYFDLSLVPQYIGLEAFNNLPDNKTSSNVEVIVLDKFQNGYLALYNDKTIFLKTVFPIDVFIGKTILINLYRKQWAVNGNIGDVYYPGTKEEILFDFTDPLLEFQFGIIKNIPYLLNTKSIITSDNSGKLLTGNSYPIKFTEFNTFKPALPNTGYQLLSITRGNEHPLYLFKDTKTNDVFVTYFLSPIRLKNRLGSFFNLNSGQYYLLTNTIPTEDSSAYLLETIYEIGNVYKFSKDGIIYYVDGQVFNISNTLVGKYFKINIVPYLLTYVEDVN